LCVCANFVLLYVQPVSNPDFVIPVEIDGTIHQVCLHLLCCYMVLICMECYI